MSKLQNPKNDSNPLAQVSWEGTKTEEDALLQHCYVEQLGRVDQIWDWLNANHGQVIAAKAPHALPAESYTYSELAEKISNVAAAFCHFGVLNGDVVALFAENSPRWLIVDQGLMRAGAADAVRGANAPIDELKYILEDSNASALVVQTSELFEALAITEEERKRLKVVVQLEGKPIHDGVMGWQELLSKGLELEQSSPDLLMDRSRDTSHKAIATILYTSGTTGRPKGVPLSHANLLHQIRSLACVAYPPAASPVLSVLPIWHAYERSAEYYFFSCACTQTYTTIKQLKNDLPKVKPIVMATVPRLWEAVQSGFEDAVKKMPFFRRLLLKSALANSSAYRLALRKVRALLIESPSSAVRLFSLIEAGVRWPFHSTASFFLWPKVLRQITGGNLRFPINGGGAIAPHVDLFFEALGVELLVGYGLTETSPVVSCRRPWRNIRGSSGSPLPETEFKIVDPETKLSLEFHQKGLVLVRGPQVMDGYFGKPEATAKVLDSEGWFDTGDLGMLLPDGSLVLTGRAKDTIVLSNGENIEPAPLEEFLVSSPLIEQVMMVGQDERQLGALIVPNVEKIIDWAELQGMPLLEGLGGGYGDKHIRQLLRREINRLLSIRAGSRSDERVLGIALVNPFSIENGLLTQTLKQRREKIFSRDKNAIDLIFDR